MAGGNVENNVLSGIVKDYLAITSVIDPPDIEPLHEPRGILWVRQDFAGVRGSIFSPSIAVDSDNNIVMAVLTPIDIFYSNNNPNVLYGNGAEGGVDIVVCKLSGIDGTVIWMRQDFDFNTTSNDIRQTIVVDKDNNIVMAFQTDGDIFYGDYNNGNILFGNGNEGGDDIVVCKLSGIDGHAIWVRQDFDFNTSDSDESPSLALDNEKNIVLAFHTTGNIFNNYNYGNLLYGIRNEGEIDIVVCKLSGIDGQTIWVRQDFDFNTRDYDLVPSIAVDRDNNIVMAFLTDGDIFNSFYINGNVLYGNGTEGEVDIVVCKLSGLDGKAIWVRQDFDFNTSGSDFLPSIAVDSDNNIVMAFLTDGDIFYGNYNNPYVLYGNGAAGGLDIVICKLSGIDGKSIWIRQDYDFNTSGNDGLTGNILEEVDEADEFIRFLILKLSIAVDKDDNIVVAFTTDGNIFYELYNNRNVLYGNGNEGNDDIVVCKVSGIDGKTIWVCQDFDFNTSGIDILPSMVVDRDNNIVMAFTSDGDIFDNYNNGNKLYGNRIIGGIVVCKLSGDRFILSDPKIGPISVSPLEGQ